MPWNFPVTNVLNEDNRKLTLRVSIPHLQTVKTIIFENQMSISEACDKIRLNIREIDQTNANHKEFGVLLPNEDIKKGIWLNPTRSFEHYLLKNGDTIEFRNKMRMLYIRTIDDTRKTLKIEDNMTVGDIMILVCVKMGIQNHEEYGLVNEDSNNLRNSDDNNPQSQREKSVSRRSNSASHGNVVSMLLREHENEKVERMKRKLHTDDDLHWLNSSQTLRQQGIEEKNVLLLRRRYFYSDMNVDSHDPIQLNLLYVQLKEAILNGTHPVTQEEAIELAGIQAQVQIGNTFQDKNNSNYALKEYLPQCYVKSKGIEKKMMQAHRRLNGVSEMEAKTKYCQFCRSLKTYGISFYLVKEKVRGKNKLVHRLLGVNKDSVVRLDEKTKEVLKIWPLTSILKWAASKHAFTMDFGEYSPHEFYTAQTEEGEQISQLIGGYIDIIMKKKKVQDVPADTSNTESTMYVETVCAEKATIVQNVHQPRPRYKEKAPDPIQIFNHNSSQNLNKFNIKDLINTDLMDGSRGRPMNEDNIAMGGVYSTSRHQSGSYGMTNNATLNHSPDETGDVLMTIGTQREYKSGCNGISQRYDHSHLSSMGYNPGTESPNEFLIGGSQTYYYKQMSNVERVFHKSIEENIRRMDIEKNHLDIGDLNDPQIANQYRNTHFSNDELSKRILNFERDAGEAKVTDEVGAMNAAVIQALRSANRADDYITTKKQFNGQTDPSYDPGDDLMTMQQSFRVVTVHFPIFVEDVKKVAMLKRKEGAMQNKLEENEPHAQDLISAAKVVADSFTELFKSARPLAGTVVMESENSVRTTEQGGDFYDANGKQNIHTRKAILDAVNWVGEASQNFLSKITQSEVQSSQVHNQYTNEEREYQSYLIELASRVAKETANLVVSAKHLAMVDDSQSMNDAISMIINKNEIIHLATGTGLATSQLVACTKVLAPTIQQPACQNRLSEAVLDVSQSVEAVLKSARDSEGRAIRALDNGAISSHEIEGLTGAVHETESAAMRVRQALHDLNQHLSILDVNIYYNDSLRSFQISYEDFLQERDVKGMLTTARTLATITSQMANEFNQKAKSIEVVNDITSDKQRRLFLAAQQLTEATSKLVQSIKSCAQNPSNSQGVIELQDNVENVSNVINQTNAEIMQDQLIKNLQSIARATLTNATQLINTTYCAADQTRAMNYYVLDDCQQVDNLNPSIAVAIQESRRYPDDALAQLELISTCQQYLEVCEKLVHSNRTLAPTITDMTLKGNIEEGTIQLSDSVSVLRACLCGVQPLARQLQLTGTLAKLKRLTNDAESIRELYSVYSTSEAPQHGDTDPRLSSMNDVNLMNTYKLLNSSVQQGHHATNTIYEQVAIRGVSNTNGLDDWRGPLCSDLSEAIADLVHATRVLTLPENIHQLNQAQSNPSELSISRETKRHLIDSTVAACGKSFELASELIDLNAKTGFNQENFSMITHDLYNNLNDCLNALPGQDQIAGTMQIVKNKLEMIENTQMDSMEMKARNNDLESLQNTVTMRIMEFNHATRIMVSSSTPQHFKQSAKEFANKFVPFIEDGHELALVNRNTNPAVSKEIEYSLKEVCKRSLVFLADAKRLCCQPETAVLHQQLVESHGLISESLNQVMMAATSNMNSTQRHVQMAVKKMRSSYSLLESSSRSLNSLGYHDNIQQMTNATGPLTDGIRGMSKTTDDNQEISLHIKQFCDSMCKIFEHASQVSYLIGVADPSSEPGKPVLVNFDVFDRAQKQLNECCRALSSKELSNKQDREKILTISEDVEYMASNIVSSCQQISNITPKNDIRHQISETSANLMHDVEQLKASARQFDPESQIRSESICNSIQSHLDYLVTLITTNPHLSGQLARITDKAKESQLPIIACGEATFNAAESVLVSADKLSQSSATPHKNETDLRAIRDHNFEMYSKATKELSAAITALFTAVNENAPGQHECAYVMKEINKLLHNLNEAQRNIINQSMPKNFEQSEEGFQMHITSTTQEILKLSPDLGNVAKSEAESLGHMVLRLDGLLKPLVNSTIGAASRNSETGHSDGTQIVYIEQTKTIIETAEQLVEACKNSGGNKLAKHHHSSVDSAVNQQMVACQDLLRNLNDISSRQGRISTLVKTLETAQKDIEGESYQMPNQKIINRQFINTSKLLPEAIEQSTSQATLQNHLLNLSKEMVVVERKILDISRDRHSKIVPSSHQITQIYTDMVSTFRQMVNSKPTDLDLMASIRLSLKRVGEAATSFVKATGSGALTSHQISSAANDIILNDKGNTSSAHFGLKQLDEKSQVLDNRLNELIDLLERRNPGNSACLKAASTVSAIIADLDTTILFASSGSVHPKIRDNVDVHLQDIQDRLGLAHADIDFSKANPETIKDSIVRTANALINDTHHLVEGAGQRQNQLADSTNSAVDSITKLADIVKTGALVIEPNQPDSQVALIRAVQNVAVAYKSLFVSASNIDSNKTEPKGSRKIEEKANKTIVEINNLLSIMNKKKDQVKVKNVQKTEASTSQAQQPVPHPTSVPHKKDNAIPIIEAIIEQLRTHANELQEETISAASNTISPNSSSKNSSSFLSRYLSPEVITKFLSNDVQSCCNKIYNASKSREVDDAVVAAINTRQFIIDLTCSVRAFVRHVSIPIESRITCAQMSSDICSEFATLLVKLKLNVEKDTQVPDIGANVQHIEDLSHDILELISTVNDGPRLVMYFRASSPQWRDVTEKYIGRHVAYHHHYVPSYQEQSGSCIQVPYDVNQEKFCIGSEASSKAREKMQTNYQLIYQMLQNSQFDGNLESFLEQCNSLFDQGTNLLSTTSTLLESPRASEKIQIGRHELVLSLAFEDFSNIIGHYYEACRLSSTDTQSSQRKTILRPSRERIITSLQQITQSALNLWLSLSEQTMKLQLSNQDEANAIQDCNVTCQNIKSIADSILTRLRNGELVCNERRSSIDYNGKIVSITVPTS